MVMETERDDVRIPVDTLGLEIQTSSHHHRRPSSTKNSFKPTIEMPIDSDEGSI